jgi:hypothetical protein
LNGCLKLSLQTKNKYKQYQQYMYVYIIQWRIIIITHNKFYTFFVCEFYKIPILFWTFCSEKFLFFSTYVQWIFSQWTTISRKNVRCKISSSSGRRTRWYYHHLAVRDLGHYCFKDNLRRKTKVHREKQEVKEEKPDIEGRRKKNKKNKENVTFIQKVSLLLFIFNEFPDKNSTLQHRLVTWFDTEELLEQSHNSTTFGKNTASSSGVDYRCPSSVLEEIQKDERRVSS